jgi:drug/metabolite transporter (DMT)-like permease
MRRYGALLIILGSSLWGTDALFRRPLTGVLSPVTIVMFEHCVLALCVLPIAIRRRSEFAALKAADYAALLMLSLGGSVAATILFTVAMKYGNPSVVILLQKTQPLIAVLMARVFLAERPARWFWPWFALAIFGACLISIPGRQNGLGTDPSQPVVILSALGAAALWGSATVCGRHVVSKISAPFLTSLRILIALPALSLLYALQAGITQRQLPADLRQSVGIIGLALIPGLAALLVYYNGLKFTSASVASVCELAFPITAVGVNWLFLNTQLTPIQISGSAILVASVTAIALAHARQQAESGPKCNAS